MVPTEMHLVLPLPTFQEVAFPAILHPTSISKTGQHFSSLFPFPSHYCSMDLMDMVDIYTTFEDFLLKENAHLSTSLIEI